MPQYFTNNDNLIKQDYFFDYDFKGKKYKFKSNNGVFSKQRVDFGTNLLIQSLPEFTCERILDMGTGLGIISIMLAGAYKSTTLVGADVNKLALSLAKSNAEQNRVLNASFVESSLYENIDSMFDVIVSNPPIRAGKDIVHGVVIDGYNHLVDGGKIYLVIQTKQGAPSLEKKMEEVFGNVKCINKKNGYLILMSVKA